MDFCRFPPAAGPAWPRQGPARPTRRRLHDGREPTGLQPIPEHITGVAGLSPSPFPPPRCPGPGRGAPGLPVDPSSRRGSGMTADNEGRLPGEGPRDLATELWSACPPPAPSLPRGSRAQACGEPRPPTGSPASVSERELGPGSSLATFSSVFPGRDPSVVFWKATHYLLCFRGECGLAEPRVRTNQMSDVGSPHPDPSSAKPQVLFE